MDDQCFFRTLTFTVAQSKTPSPWQVFLDKSRGGTWSMTGDAWQSQSIKEIIILIKSQVITCCIWSVNAYTGKGITPELKKKNAFFVFVPARWESVTWNRKLGAGYNVCRYLSVLKANRKGIIPVIFDVIPHLSPGSMKAPIGKSRPFCVKNISLLITEVSVNPVEKIQTMPKA